jgi:hypothetical protein
MKGESGVLSHFRHDAIYYSLSRTSFVVSAGRRKTQIKRDEKLSPGSFFCCLLFLEASEFSIKLGRENPLMRAGVKNRKGGHGLLLGAIYKQTSAHFPINSKVPINQQFSS